MTERKESDEIDYKYVLAVIGGVVVLIGISPLLNPTSVSDIIAGIVALPVGLYLMALPLAPDITKNLVKAITTLLLDVLRLVTNAFAYAVIKLNHHLKERKEPKQAESACACPVCGYSELNTVKRTVRKQKKE